MLKKHGRQLDIMIKTALQQLETEAQKGMPDIETAWANFETALEKRKPKQKKQIGSFFKLALTASVALVLLLSSQSEQVTAFKNEVFQWLGRDVEQGAILSEIENPEIEPGIYKGLSFDEAQEKTIFRLLKPSVLPVGVNPTPDIELQVQEYPLVHVEMKYEGKQKSLIISQENSPGNMQRNTFVPQNVECKEVRIESWNVLIVGQGSIMDAQWIENGIHYQITTAGLQEEELIDTIKNLK